LRDVANSKSLRPFIDEEVSPGPAVRSDEDLDIHVRATAMTAYHPLGTCKMGNERDPEAVVDSRLRVRGIEALRVVDASVMPDHIGGNINGPVIMIAEMAADIIRGFPGLQPSAIH
jgi:choline dehydrogenase/4-pyridoxate dehydrogenase